MPSDQETGKEQVTMLKRKKKETAPEQQAAVEQVVESVKALETEKIQKKEKKRKVKLVINAPSTVTIKTTKFVTIASNADKKLWMRGSTVGLTSEVDVKTLKKVSEEDAKKNHLGKTKMIGRVSSQEELDGIVTKFFS